MILVPSAQRFEAGLLSQHASNAIIAIEPTLAAAHYRERVGALSEGVRNAVGRYGITGILLVGPDGKALISAGETDRLASQLAHATPMATNRTRAPDGARLDIAWPTQDGIVVAARIDTSMVSDQVIAYSIRIGGLVGIIVLVVTLGTMLVLHGLVLRPVLRLRASARSAAADPDRAELHVVKSGRLDEIGDLIQSHNTLLEQVAASKRLDHALAEERAHYISSHEPLTGLPNRSALLQHLKRQSGKTGSVSLFLVNVFQFRVLNASIGSEPCDELLRQLSRRLARASRPEDFVAHLGADRFAVARSHGDFNAQCAAEVAERLLASISSEYDLGGVTQRSVAVRIGIACRAAETVEGKILINEAELALARTRTEDAPRYEFYAPSFGEEARNRQMLVRDLERGIEGGEFFIVLQPKIALDSAGAIHLSGAEVLVRWQHPVRGPVGPADFIPLAEATGLIVSLGDRVLVDTCALLRSWIDRYGQAPRLAVNLSARQFALPDLEQRLERTLADAKVPPALLEVEITESAAMKNVQQTAGVLANLRSLGVRVSIDDFGTGYSSLAYLRRFSVDAIKIDKSFVDEIGIDRNAEVICDAILRLGRALGCKVVAEGVETAAQVAFLRRRRCDEAQGFFYGKPMLPDQFESAWIRTRAVA